MFQDSAGKTLVAHVQDFEVNIVIITLDSVAYHHGTENELKKKKTGRRNPEYTALLTKGTDLSVTRRRKNTAFKKYRSKGEHSTTL